MNLTYLGHSSFHIHTKGFNIIFDPFISPNSLASGIDIKNIKSDFILLSHGHGDHLADAEFLSKQNDSTIISNYEIVSWYESKGIKGHPMNHGGKRSFEFGTVKYVNAIHSSMLPDGSYGGAPGGFVVWNNEVSFYFAGDTALTWDMKLIPITCPKLDFAILPIGDNFTMGYEDAVIASDFIQVDKIIACHYDTFGYIKINHDAAIKEFKNAGKELILLEPGSSLEF
ncbi:MAG: metal-dependent hydrolase [Saprospiraceae bacterium]|jgi:L-ascorbate metabolism protein UlaG (beta-lactamase superfamily)|nr:metal-dependent hydrolase [Saprospiraceae bacterium]MBL0025021.1 metal-dependent hydrolase [Saprospiraceae bacterium]